MVKDNGRYNIITPKGLKPTPNCYEKAVAELMAEYLQSDIEFIKRNTSTTPDILALKYNQIWEIKNIRGNNRNTISRNLKGIYRQSENVIITLFQTDMTINQAIGRAKDKLSKANRIKRLVLISKSKKVVVIK